MSSAVAAPTARGNLARGRSGVLLRLAVAVIVIAVLAWVPLSASPFTNLQLSLVAAYAVAIRGLDVLTGHAGQVSLGQSAFFGIGAYATAYSFTAGWSVWIGLLLAIGVAAVVGFLAAIPAVRLHGFAFGIITLALPVVAVPLANRLSGITGGSQGVSVSLLPAPEWSGLANDQWHYYIVVVIAAVSFLLLRNFLKGRVGRALDMVRTNETVAAAMGVPVRRYKVLAFTVAATAGGVAGWLYLVPVGFMSPESMLLTVAVQMLVVLVVGGLRSPLGSVIGAAVLIFLPTLTDKVAPGRSYLFFGVALLIVLLFFPAGIDGGLRALARRVFRLRRATEQDPHDELRPKQGLSAASKDVAAKDMAATDQ